MEKVAEEVRLGVRLQSKVVVTLRHENCSTTLNNNSDHQRAQSSFSAIINPTAETLAAVTDDDTINHAAAVLTINVHSIHREMNPHAGDAWLPITESREGNAFTATLHLLCSGIGLQALLLPVAFISLGWFWGILSLVLMFVWQLYTIWLLVHLHESTTGTRYSRYLHLSTAAFGEKLGKLLAIFPTMYLSGGTCVIFVITGGGTTMKLLYEIVCGDDHTCYAKILTGSVWFLVFVSLAVFVAQFFPNLNSLSRVSMIGSVTAVGYCTLIWVLSISKPRPPGVSYQPSEAAAASAVDRIRDILNASGMIALAFRGHNVVLEIQGTMPSNPKKPSHQLMWRGVMTSYLLISMCLFPVAIGGYWAYGNLMPESGMLSAFSKYHRHDTPNFVLGTVYMMVVINCLSSYQIYAMPVFDNLERLYVSKKNRACPRSLRSGIKVFFGGLTYLVAVAFPFLRSLGAFIGAITLPLTLAYPCFMWIAIHKDKSHRNITMWYLNLGLGSLGMMISVVLVAAALWNLVANGLEANFFHPR